MRKLLIAFMCIMSSVTIAGDCVVIKAAFDIGSGTTKLKVAKVDICKSKILEILHESNKFVEYKQSLKESKNNTLSENILAKGIARIQELKREAQEYKPIRYVAVATSAFRTAENGADAAKKITRATGVEINIISQEQEAKIGFVGASSISDNDLKKIVVWDIGGGSMQMTSYEGNGQYTIYKGKLASVSFKNLLIEEVQNKQAVEVHSPNPISKDDFLQSVRDARIYAKYTVPQAIIKKLKSKDTQVIGIGGVHYNSIGKVVSKTNIYSINMVNNHIKSSFGLNDEQLGGGKYVSTYMSNLILVSGFMEGLNVKKVKVGKINLADGLLVMPSLVKK